MDRKLGGIIFAALIPGAFAQGTSTTFLGIELGSPLSLPECAIDHDRYGSMSYSSEQQVACWADKSFGSEKGSGITPERGRVDLIGLDVPNTVSKYGVYAAIESGVVVKVTASVPALRDQQDTVILLTEKYGKPKHLGTEVKSNAYGAKIESISGTWETDDAIIIYIGATKISGDGLVVAQTKSHAKNQLEANRPKGSF